MAEVVQAAMKPYLYDVQICFSCNAADAPRIVSEPSADRNKFV
jgi:ribosomal protein L40E